MSSSPLPPSTCAVTGAGGFVGSHLVAALLRAGWSVRALVHYRGDGAEGHLPAMLTEAGEAGRHWLASGQLQIIMGDVCDARCVTELVADCPTVFHLAALIGIPYSYRAPQSYLQTNVQGTLHVLEACRDAGTTRLLITSTSEVYGTAQMVPMTELHPLHPQSPYAASKSAADQMALAYHASFGLPVVVARPFNIYGPRQSARAVIPTVLGQLLDPTRTTVEVGALDPVRDWTFVEDTVAGLIQLAELPATALGQVFHIGSGAGHTVGEMIEAAMRVTGIHKPVHVSEQRLRPPASEVERLLCDAGRLRQASDWVPRVDFEQGLARTADWLRGHLATVHPGEYVL